MIGSHEMNGLPGERLGYTHANLEDLGIHQTVYVYIYVCVIDIYMYINHKNLVVNPP